MGRVRHGLVIGGLALVAALVVAPGASARHVQVHVNIKDQNGYRMSIEASRSARRVIRVASGKVEGPNPPAPVRALSRRHAVEAAKAAPNSTASDAKLRATSGFISVQVQNHHAISTYGVQGTVTHNRLFGRLGHFGRISLRFHLRHKRTVRNGCFGEDERLGVFKGRVRFRGEDDYVSVKARELHGKVETRRGRSNRCGASITVALPPGRSHKVGSTAKPGRGGHDTHRYTLLFASKDSHRSSRFFAAIKETRQWTAYLTDSFELGGPVLIDREEYGSGKAGDFRVARTATAARIKPSPRRYRGAGHFRAREKHNHWKGSLATSMPGAPHVRLAGKNFRAELARKRGR